jgi:hypothetical protein
MSVEPNDPSLAAYWREPKGNPKCRFCGHPYRITEIYTWGDRIEFKCPIQRELVQRIQKPCAYFIYKEGGR